MAGAIVGQYGDVVVDSIRVPSRVMGAVHGFAPVLCEPSWDLADRTAAIPCRCSLAETCVHCSRRGPRVQLRLGLLS